MLQRSGDSRTPPATPERPDHSSDLNPGEEPQPPMLQRSGDSSRAPLATPEHTDHSSDLSPEEEDHLFVTLPEGDRPPGIAREEFIEAEGDTSGNFPEQPEELAAPRDQLTPTETPAGTKPQPPTGPDAPDEDTSSPEGDEEGQPSEPELVAASTRLSSPAAEGLDHSAVPPFQWSQPLNLSSDSRRNDFESPNGKVTRLYQHHLGKTYMRATDWTYYHAQDEANPTEYHPDWPTSMKEMGPILIPAGSETNPNRTRIPPLSPTYLGRTLWRKIADIEQQKSWGNLQEHPGILQHMRTTDKVIKDDPDWANTLRRCRKDPAESYLHTVLPTGEVLPFSEAVAIAYEYPCTLGKQQEGLHKWLVYSSTSGIPLITPALSGRLRLQDR